MGLEMVSQDRKGCCCDSDTKAAWGWLCGSLGVNFASQRSGSGISALALQAKWWLCCVGVLRWVFEAIIIQRHSEADAVFGRFNWRVLVTGMIMEV